MARAERLSGVVWLVAGMVLVPYATVLLPFESALRAQAALLVVALAIAAWPARRAHGWPGVLPRPVRIGLALYAGAAAWGAVVGFAAGNPTRFVVSQFLSMALLPASTLVFAARRDVGGETLLRGLAAAAAAALALHVAAGFFPGLAGEVPGHFGFDLRNAVGVAGVAPLIWLLGAAHLRAGPVPWAVAAACTAAALCLWSQSRGAWVSAFAGTLALATLMARRPWRALALSAAAGAATLAAVLALGTMATGDAGRGRATSSGGADTSLRLAPPDAVAAGAETQSWRALDGVAVQVTVTSRGDHASHLWVWTEFADGAGRTLGKRWVEGVGAGRWTRWSALVAAPVAARSFRTGLRLDGGPSPWSVESVEAMVVRSRVEGLGRQLVARVSSLARALADPAADGALRYRMTEAAAVTSVWSRAGVGRRLAGFGLGATFPFANPSFDGANPIVAPRASYIHDFYLFLVFKLGIAGIAALAGLVLVAAWTARTALGLRGRPERQWLVAGASAAWLAYLAWSVTSPEIYDFRIAPLWGALVAACCRDAGGGGAGTATVRSPLAGAGLLRVERLTSDDALSRLRAEWDDLLAGSRSATVALSHAWLANWWELFRDRGTLALFTVRDAGGALIGLAPFAARTARCAGAVRVRRLELLGTGETRSDAICSEYLDVIARGGREPEVVEALADDLSGPAREGWDEIVLAGTLPESTAAALVSAMAARGFRRNGRDMARCPVVALPDAEDEVAGLLSPMMRRKAASHARRLARAGRVELASCRSEAAVAGTLERLVTLHQQRWARRLRPGCFASARFRAFHERIAPVLFREGRLALYSLAVGGTVVSVLYGFRDGTRLLAYQWGSDTRFAPTVSLGLVMLHLCLQRAVSEGVREWDFLRGEEPYKLHWARRSRTIVELRVWNTTAAASIARRALLTRRAVGLALRRSGLRSPRSA